MNDVVTKVKVVREMTGNDWGMVSFCEGRPEGITGQIERRNQAKSKTASRWISEMRD
jgi:hypothetical protein